MNPPSRDYLPPPVKAPPPRRFRLRFNHGRILSGIAALMLLFALASFFVPGPLIEAKTVIIPLGTSPREIATVLDQADAIYSPVVFRVAVKLVAGNVLKAGEYNLEAGQSMASILYMIHNGRSVQRNFTVAEGLTSNEVVRLLNAAVTMTGDVGPMPAEGSILPETYRYMFGDTRSGVVARMQKSMQDMLADLWAKRDPKLPLTSPEQAVIMASIIEKETGKPAERARIAGVFYNRLQHNMRLQSDPTVIYGIMKAKGFMDHDIGHTDLAFPSPYNSYLNDGLPPGPICNPGKAALEAAMHPEWNDYLFFVADGTGGHVFARTLAEHNQNVTKWNELQSGK